MRCQNAWNQKSKPRSPVSTLYNREQSRYNSYLFLMSRNFYGAFCNSGGIYGLSIRNQTNCGLPTVPHLPRVPPQPYGCVSGQPGCVSKPHMKKVVQKVAQILATQGVSCCECPRTQYKLYPLSDCKETDLRYSLQIVCPDGKMPYRFELTLSPVIPPEDRSNAPVNQTGTQNEERR